MRVSSLNRNERAILAASIYCEGRLSAPRSAFWGRGGLDVPITRLGPAFGHRPVEATGELETVVAASLATWPRSRLR